MDNAVIIRDEEDIYRLLQDYTDGKTELSETKLIFENYSVTTLRLSGKGLDGTMPTAVMPFFMEMQHAIYRGYALEVYDKASHRLTDEEKEKLALCVKIEKGSSVFSIDLSSIIKAFIDKVPSEHVAIVILGVVALYLGANAFKYYVAKREETKRIKMDRETSISLSQEETKRHEILTKVLKSAHWENSDNMHKEALRAIAKSETGEIGDVRLKAEEAAYLARNPQRKSGTVRLDAVYRILAVDTRQPDEYRVLIRNDKREELRARVRTADWKPEMKKVLQEGEWDRQDLYMEISATALFDKKEQVVEYRDIYILSARKITFSDASEKNSDENND